MEERFTNIANKYNTRIGRFGHSVLDNCSFCLVYSSGFAFDCFLRDVPVAVFSPSYFWQTKAVTYTSRTFPNKVNDTVEYANKLADFVVWRYMFDMQQSSGKWLDMFRHVNQSKELFPINDTFCYAKSILNRCKQKEK